MINGIDAPTLHFIKNLNIPKNRNFTSAKNVKRDLCKVINQTFLEAKKNQNNSQLNKKRIPQNPEILITQVIINGKESFELAAFDPQASKKKEISAADGTIYKGLFQDNKFWCGIIVYPDGNNVKEEIGTFDEQGKLHSYSPHERQCIRIFASGTVCEGVFERGTFKSGTITWPSNSTTNENEVEEEKGRFDEQGRLHSIGQEIYKRKFVNGSTYLGRFDRDVFKSGTITWPSTPNQHGKDVKREKGTFDEEENLHSINQEKCSRELVDGTLYEGKFEHDMFTFGRITYPYKGENSVKEEVGTFDAESRLQGEGRRVFWDNNKVQQGKFKDGIFLGQ